MTHRGPFQPLPFCDSVFLSFAAVGPCCPAWSAPRGVFPQSSQWLSPALPVAIADALCAALSLALCFGLRGRCCVCRLTDNSFHTTVKYWWASVRAGDGENQLLSH